MDDTSDSAMQPERPISVPSGIFPHSPNAQGEWHDLRDHLESVARLARPFTRPLSKGAFAELAGFWCRLVNKPQRTAATCGAAPGSTARSRAR